MSTSAATSVSQRDRIAARIPDSPGGIAAHREALASVAVLIAERFQPDQIVLYGSRVYGAPTGGSDADLMVVMDAERSASEQTWIIRDELHALIPKIPVSIDIKVRTPQQIRVGLAERDFFIEDAMLKGVTLYARGGLGTETCPEHCMEEIADTGCGKLKHATQEWIERAEIDMASAKHLLDAPEPIRETSCFHAQQCAEKYLKAWLQEREASFPRTHDLGEFARLAPDALPSLVDSFDDLSWLSHFAVDLRYPGATAVAADAERALAIATRVRADIRGVLAVAETSSG